ncbi:phytoene desaturase family protein [Schauerella aestuarii]|uniref:phytoene desaturase family protein n=1 Tax=Schauerella aestuarii TaxID=2511204 RepID=UPI00137143A7|nr:NAD(P)/FAD-dependent oxidoreductase [Achromobacter aestuarii]MYZ45305.1 NAD(P)/FAD-dependent oxidoreductase [Achromobacter aestuarii]
MQTASPQIIIVGSGINALVCAAVLAKRGKTVHVFERNDTLGGCIRTVELFPGYRHETLSSWYPLFMASPGYAELKDDLAAAGVRFPSNGYTTGLVTPDGEHLALTHDIADTAARMNRLAPGDGDAFATLAGQLFQRDAQLTFGLLGEDPYGFKLLRTLFGAWRARGIGGLLNFASESLESFRRWSERTFTSPTSRALLAPWVLHSGIGPDDATSALIGKVTFAAVTAGGMPVVEGGGEKLVEGLAAIIRKHGGQLSTGAHVERVLLTGNTAVGVRANGRDYLCSESVVCNVTPTQLYRDLLPQAPQAVRDSAAAYRYGRGCMQIHFALSRPPTWPDAELLSVPLVHVTESMENVCLAVVEANNGQLPRYPTIAVGQPVAVDATRAPAGGWILWLQLQDMPSKVRGDAAGEIAAEADFTWSPRIREAMADRIQHRLERVLPDLASCIVGRVAYSPADLEAMNCNLVGGDPYSGICSPDQFFWFRPFAKRDGVGGHKTPYGNVFHIGAATHPGPGLGGNSGYQVANKLAKRR